MSAFLYQSARTFHPHSRRTARTKFYSGVARRLLGSYADLARRGFSLKSSRAVVAIFLIDLRQARPTRIAFLGGEQVMTHSGEKIVARNLMAKFSYDCDRGVVIESQRRLFTSFRGH